MKCVKCHKREGTIELPIHWSIAEDESDGLVCGKCYAWIENWEIKHRKMVDSERDQEKFSYQDEFSWIDECGSFSVIE